VANKIADGTNIEDIFIKHLQDLGLKKQAASEQGGDMRFASKKKS
jgi:hypothetical protein